MAHTEEVIRKKVEVLIVEDSPTQADRLKYVLEEEGFSVNWKSNGQLALRYLQDQQPDLIVSDVLMPQMDGFTFCSEVKKMPEHKDIPIILLTTLSDPADIIRGLESGADNFITKPFEKDYLLSRIDYIIFNRRLRKSSDRMPSMGIEIYFSGKKYFITAERMQIIDLLFSTYEAVVQKNRQLEQLNRQLKEAHENITELNGLIPICPSCKKVRNDDGYWEQVEVYIRNRSEVDFSHSICPPVSKNCTPSYRKRKKKERPHAASSMVQTDK